MSDKKLPKSKRKSAVLSLPSVKEDDRKDAVDSLLQPKKDSNGSGSSKHKARLSRSVTFAPEDLIATENDTSGQEEKYASVASSNSTDPPQLKPDLDVNESQSHGWQHPWREVKKDVEPASSIVESQPPPSKTGTLAGEPSQGPVSQLPLENTQAQNMNVKGEQQENDKQDIFTPSTIAIATGIPPEAIKTVRVQQHLPKPGPTPDRPIAPKVLVLKKTPAALTTKPSETTIQTPPIESVNFPYVLHEDEMLEETPDDKQIDKKLTEMMNIHRDYVLRNLKRSKKAFGSKYKFSEMVDTLSKQGIPCPINEDYGRLHGVHSKWDPKGTVLEYYSPMLRTFVPVNMRGRYRGCWSTDDCVKGINISDVKPKRDALEGFVERGRHSNIQEKYNEMSSIASDEAHLDYLLEIQSYHAETLPIPIFYDMLHVGIEVANENLRLLVQAEGYAPNDPIFISVKGHADQLRRKIQMYGALGLETLKSERKGLGQYRPEWLKSRDEIIRDIMTAKDMNRYTNLQNTEKEAGMKEDFRRDRTKSSGNWRTSKSRGSNIGDSNTSGVVSFKDPSVNQSTHTNMESDIDITLDKANVAESTTSIHRTNFEESTTSLDRVNLDKSTTSLDRVNLEESTTSLHRINFEESTTSLDRVNLEESTTSIDRDNVTKSTTYSMKKSNVLAAIRQIGRNKVAPNPDPQSGIKSLIKLLAENKDNPDPGKKED